MILLIKYSEDNEDSLEFLMQILQDLAIYEYKKVFIIYPNIFEVLLLGDKNHSIWS